MMSGDLVYDFIPLINKGTRILDVID